MSSKPAFEKLELDAKPNANEMDRNFAQLQEDESLGDILIMGKMGEFVVQSLVLRKSEDARSANRAFEKKEFGYDLVGVKNGVKTEQKKPLDGVFHYRALHRDRDLSVATNGHQSVSIYNNLSNGMSLQSATLLDRDRIGPDLSMPKPNGEARLSAIFQAGNRFSPIFCLSVIKEDPETGDIWRANHIAKVADLRDGVGYAVTANGSAYDGAPIFMKSSPEAENKSLRGNFEESLVMTHPTYLPAPETVVHPEFKPVGY